MKIAHDTIRALNAAVALVNSGDSLATVADLDAFVRAWEWTGRHTGTPGELAEVQAMRPRLRQWWDSDDEQAVVLTNDLLVAGRALPQLTRHDGYSWHLHATSADAPLADQMAVEAAMAMVDVIRMDALERLRICAAEDCQHVLIDLTRNRSRRFCDGGCGNRTNVAAYRARRAGHT